MSARQIPQDVLLVLEAGRCEGSKFYLPAKALDRKLYERTNDVLTALGGKWNRSAKAHLFDDDCDERISNAIDSGTYSRSADLGWFPTPPKLAQEIVDLAEIEAGMRVLEPSAGHGALVQFILDQTTQVTAYELDPERAGRCFKTWGVHATAADFLTIEPDPAFDRVVMNPPFAKRADIHHVLHARKFLAPGGKLVAIMSAGVKFRQDRLATEFRTQCDTIEALPDSSFASSGTEVRTVVVTMSAET